MVRGRWLLEYVGADGGYSFAIVTHAYTLYYAFLVLFLNHYVASFDNFKSSFFFFGVFFPINAPKNCRINLTYPMCLYL